MEVALDLALQASPDHPWVKEHPEWFTTRADGSIAYAENPPKKYQDIYPINFDNDPEGIYAEVLRIVRLWMEHGVRIFRVDNPHTKPLRFWERLLAEIRVSRPRRAVPGRGVHPAGHDAGPGQDRLPPVLHVLHLAERRWELTEYMRELAGGPRRTCGPTSSPTRPDILHAYLQHGGPPAFKIRAVLAAMLSPTLGHLLRVRAVRERPAAAGQRGVHGLGEVPVPAARLGRAPPGPGSASPTTSPSSTGSGAPTRPCTGCAISASTPSTSRN